MSQPTTPDTTTPQTTTSGTGQPLTLTSRPAATIDSVRRDQLVRRIRIFVAVTISYNVIEAVIAIVAGTLASSTALIGFGLDSTVEVASAAAVAWQFSARDHAVREHRERRALRIIAISFFALATYIIIESARGLLMGEPAEESVPGIVLAAVSLVVMPFLSYAQRRAGRELGSATAVADSKQTLLCTYLSGVLLIGLLLNATLGWAWADPLVALVIAAVAIKEGVEAWRGDSCCAVPISAIGSDPDQGDSCGCEPGCSCCN